MAGTFGAGRPCLRIQAFEWQANAPLLSPLE